MERYIASLTREQFLFYEMRITAGLLIRGLSETEIIEQIRKENLFQYPTGKTVERMAKACLKRLNAMNDEELVRAIVLQPVTEAKQICLYAMMKQSRLLREFMLTVIGEKYRLQDNTFGRIDLNVYFIRLQEQSNVVASWSEETIGKLKQVFTRTLVETGYLDNVRADHLNPVYLYPILENAIKKHGENILLPAFHCFD